MGIEVCKKKYNDPSFPGSDIGVIAPKWLDTGAPIGGRAGKYYILDDGLNILHPDKRAEGRFFFLGLTRMRLSKFYRTKRRVGKQQMDLHSSQNHLPRDCQQMLCVLFSLPSRHWCNKRRCYCVRQ